MDGIGRQRKICMVFRLRSPVREHGNALKLSHFSHSQESVDARNEMKTLHSPQGIQTFSDTDINRSSYPATTAGQEPEAASVVSDVTGVKGEIPSTAYFVNFSRLVPQENVEAPLQAR